MSLRKKVLIPVLVAIAVSILAVSINSEGVSIYVQPEEYKTTATMIVDFPEPCNANIDMYDENNNLVDSFYRGETQKGEMVFVLDRYGSDGSFLPNGKYEINVTTTGRYISTKKTVILK
jgi:flagellar hook assembly protein FlgD